jgi:hypothetical protein
MDKTGLIFELMGGRKQNISRRCDQPSLLQDPIDAAFGDKNALLIGDLDGQLPARQCRVLEGQLHHQLLLIVRNRIPLPTRLFFRRKTQNTFVQVNPVPLVKRALMNA